VLTLADNNGLALAPFGKSAGFIIRIFKKKEPTDFANPNRYLLIAGKGGK
jgi:hypothetical protein